jgi:hypothetical protein
MDWPDYLREQAAMYRQLAEQAGDPVVKTELLELASYDRRVIAGADATGAQNLSTAV